MPVAVAVAVRVIAPDVAGVGGGEAVQPVVAGAEAEAAALGAEAGVEAGTAVAAGTDFAVHAVRRAGEDVDHAGDGVRAPDRRARAAHDLDALDGGQRQVREIEDALAGGVDAHAVDQHQRVVGVAAAQEQRVLRAAAAGAHQVDAGLLRQQVADVGDAAGFDVRARQHGHRLQGAFGRLFDAVAGDLHAVQPGRRVLGGRGQGDGRQDGGGKQSNTG